MDITIELPLKTFKIILVGDIGVGKTTFLRYIPHGAFTRTHKPTMGAKVHTLTLSTTLGPINFSLWDTAGREELAGLGSGYYMGAKVAILMYKRGNITETRRCYRISMKSGDRVERPLLGLAKALMGDAKLKFTKPPLLAEGLQKVGEEQLWPVLRIVDDRAILNRFIEWSDVRAAEDGDFAGLLQELDG
ncbi:hypothetical protein TWF694_007457 [Orbilia ellipsospora]|uniref:Uncharacterized protein n=1 Tax=Orbilia ellipsospora TaxID=2528407 RepID=A0AAV9XIP4_9PEZI